MLTIEASRSRSGGRCIWEKGGFNGENHGYSQIVADKFGNPKLAMMLNTKGEMICGNHVLFAMKEGEFIVTDMYTDGLHHIKVMQVIGAFDICDATFLTVKLCWEYHNKQWSVPSPEVFSIKERISEVVNVAMDKALYEGCCEGFYYKEKGN